MSDTNTNLYVTLMGRYGGGLITPKLRTDLGSLTNAFTKMERDTTQAAQASLSGAQQFAGRQAAYDAQRLRSAQRLAADLTRVEDVRKRAAINADEAVLKSRERLDANLLQLDQIREREQLAIESRKNKKIAELTTRQQMMFQQAYERNALQNERAARAAELADQRALDASRARSIASNAAYGARSAVGTLGASGASNRMLAQSSAASLIPSQDLRAVSNLYTPGAAFTSLGGAGVVAGGAGLAGLLYGGLKLANYYGGFQAITQQTAANTNLSAGALSRLRSMEIASRLQTRGTQTGINDAYFRALNLGYRTPGGGIRPGASGFVNTVMQSALPSGASSDQVANMLGQTMNAYKNNRGVPGVMSPDWYMNVIHAAGAGANLNVGQMAQFYGPVASMAAASNSQNSLRESLAMMGALTQLGFRPTKAATDVAQIYQKLEHPTSTGKTDLASIYYATNGKTNLWGDFTPQGLAQKGALGVISDLRNALNAGTITRQQILDLFPGTRGGQGLLSLLSPGGQQKIASNLSITSGQNAQGQIEKQYQGYLGTRAGQLATTRANLGSLGLTLGKPLNDDLTAAIKGFNGFSGAISGFSVKNAAAVQGVEQFIIKMTTLQGAFKMIEWPIQAAGNLFSHGFVGSMKMAWQTASGFGGKVGNALTNGIPLIKGPLDTIASLFKDTFDKIGGWASDLGANIDKLMPSDHALPRKAAGVRPGYTWVPPRRVPADKGSLASHSMKLVPGHWVRNGSPTDSSYTSKNALIMAAGTAWTTGQKGSPVRGSTFGNFSNPQNDYQNRQVGTYASDRPGASSFYHGLLGGHGPYYDTDYVAKSGGPENVRLPGHGKWTYVGAYKDPTGRGGIGELWRDPTGNTDIFWHMGMGPSGDPSVNPHGRMTLQNGKWTNLKPGKQYAGGTVVGQSGYAGGAWHFCIVTSADGRQYLAYLSDSQITQAKRNGDKVSKDSLPTPPPQSTKGTYGPLLKQHGDQFNYAALSSGVPVGILQSVSIVESGVGKTSKYYLGYMDPATKGDWSAQIQDAASTLSGYYNTPGTAAYHNWTVALEMYNAGPYATKAQLAADKGYATKVGQAYAGLGHSTLANWNGAKTKAKTPTPYANAIYNEKATLSDLNRMWKGVKASTLPTTGNGGLNQQAFLAFEYKQNLLGWQITSNQHKQYALLHHWSKAHLDQILKQDKAAYNRQNQNARFRNSSAGGEADFVRMPELVGRCKAEAEANILRRKRIKQGENAAKANDTKIRLLRQIERHLGGADHPGRHVHARAVAGTGGHAIGHDPRLHGFTNDTLVGS